MYYGFNGGYGLHDFPQLADTSVLYKKTWRDRQKASGEANGSGDRRRIRLWGMMWGHDEGLDPTSTVAVGKRTWDLWADIKKNITLLHKTESLF